MTLPVSVILPVKNGARFVAAALRSVILEEPAEIIVIDDHSTDGTWETTGKILTEEVPPATKWKILASHGHGCGPARNKGLALSSWPWIAMIDADDVWLPGKLKKQLARLVEYHEASPNHAYASSKAEQFVSDGFSLPDTLRADKLGVIDLQFPSNLLCHRLVFELVGGFDPELVCANDVDWYHRAHKLGVERVHVPEVLVRKRVHDQNLSLCQGHDMQRQILSALKREITPNMFPVWK